jgi:hypothetical protein
MFDSLRIREAATPAKRGVAADAGASHHVAGALGIAFVGLDHDDACEPTSVDASDGSSGVADAEMPRRARAALACAVGALQRHRVHVTMWIFLALLGLSASTLAFGLDLIMRSTNEVRVRLSSASAGATLTTAEQWTEYIVGRAVPGGYPMPWFARYAAWIASTALLAASATALTALVAPGAAGSGIPEMYSLMSAYTSRRATGRRADGRRDSLADFLSVRTLAVKAIGTVLVVGSGLPVGREGPYVAVCACLCALMQKLGVFHRFRTSPALRQQMLSAACALGISLAFDAPLGGVLFSIEATSSFYHVSHYWKGFFVSVVGAMWLQNLKRMNSKQSCVCRSFLFRRVRNAVCFCFVLSLSLSLSHTHTHTHTHTHATFAATFTRYLRHTLEPRRSTSGGRYHSSCS